MGEELSDLISQCPEKVGSFIFSTVRGNESTIKSHFKNEQILILNHQTPIPIRLDYKTPETLGLDRIAAAVGAHHLYKKDLLVIDAGTCITYDLVDKQGIYRGGVISPGLQMRMRAMSNYTAALPDISSEWEEIPDVFPGKSTKECLLHGAKQAILHEMNGFIDQFTEEYTHLSVILTGGDTPHFESNLKAPIFADFDLVLTGLNRILNYNK